LYTSRDILKKLTSSQCIITGKAKFGWHLFHNC
ncbi:hypothetical protein T4D_10011, partial [Trichinella pseudospiralis]